MSFQEQPKPQLPNRFNLRSLKKINYKQLLNAGATQPSDKTIIVNIKLPIGNIIQRKNSDFLKENGVYEDFFDYNVYAKNYQARRIIETNFKTKRQANTIDDQEPEITKQKQIIESPNIIKIKQIQIDAKPKVQSMDNGLVQKNKHLKRLNKITKTFQNKAIKQERNDDEAIEILKYKQTQNELLQQLRNKKLNKVSENEDKNSIVSTQNKQEQIIVKLIKTQELNDHPQAHKQIAHKEVQTELIKSINNSPCISSNKAKKQIKQIRPKEQQQILGKEIQNTSNQEKIEDDCNEYIDYQIPKKSDKIRQQRIAMIEELEKRLGLDQIEFELV